MRRKKLTEQEKSYRARTATNNRLYKKALKDKPEFKAPKGKKFLKDVAIGTLIETSLSRAILISTNNTSCTVLVTEYYGADNTDYYSGKQRWSPHTVIEVIG